MKKILNVLAYIVTVVFVGLWDRSIIGFKELLFNVGVILAVLFTVHVCIEIYMILKSIKNIKHKKLA